MHIGGIGYFQKIKMSRKKRIVFQMVTKFYPPHHGGDGGGVCVWGGGGGVIWVGEPTGCFFNLPVFHTSNP